MKRSPRLALLSAIVLTCALGSGVMVARGDDEVSIQDWADTPDGEWSMTDETQMGIMSPLDLSERDPYCDQTPIYSPTYNNKKY